MGEFGRGFNRDSGLDLNRPAQAAGADAGTVRGGGHRTVIETRTRGEAYADLRQIAAAGPPLPHTFER